MGAENDSKAPYNELPAHIIRATVSLTISKTVELAEVAGKTLTELAEEQLNLNNINVSNWDIDDFTVIKE